MQWLWLALLLAGVAVAVPVLDEATERTEVAAAAMAGAPPAGNAVRVSPDGRGQFVVEAVVAGRDITMLADTGASAVVLTSEDARRAGFNPSALAYDVPVHTANGTAHAARVVLSRLSVDGIARRDVPALVAQPGALRQSLLGMTFLGRLREVAMREGTLLLVD